MPLSHTRTFRVRNYECDAYGHLNNANYVRFMQETAMDASSAAGYGVVRYTEMGRQWWIRATEIEYLKPVVFNDQIEIKTWVADFRRISSRRMYEFHLAGTGELVARGYSDWVFLETATGKPTSVPPEMGDAFFPEGLPEKFPEREPFPVAPPPPPGAFKMGVNVAWKDIDAVQHVNNAAYLEYVEECGMQVVAAHKWPWKRMAEAGFAIFLRKHQIQYLQPAYIGDKLELSTWAFDVRRSTATRYYAIRRTEDGALLAQVHSLGVWVDLTTGHPIRIPPDFLADFAPNLAVDHQLPRG
jgi:acyl-CoA thioester hydrolase